MLTKFINFLRFKIFGTKIVYNQDLILGEVNCKNITWYNGFFIGLSPLLLIPAAWFIYNFLLNSLPLTITNQIFILFITISILVNSIPSEQDIKVAFSNKIIPLAIFLLVTIYIYQNELIKLIMEFYK